MPTRYWSGFFTGVIFVLVVMTLVFGVQVVPELRAMYGEFLGGGGGGLGATAGRELPGLTRIVLSPVWSFGAPVVVGGGAALLNVTLREHRHQPVALGLTALLALGVGAATVVGAYAPIWSVAGKIH